MQPIERHLHQADSVVDGGDLDCGGGLLLLIRRSIDPLPRGGLLEVRSTETSVDVELPAWCRLTENELVSWTRTERQRSFLVCKGSLDERRVAPSAPPVRARGATATAAAPALSARAVPRVEALSVTGIGSWPRPRWMVQAMHEYLEGRLSEGEFQTTADDAVHLALAAQTRAGADILTDGEQRRDSYVSFVGTRLENCQLVPLTDLLPMVDEPEKLAREFASLDVPADQVRHPVLLGRLARTQPIAGHEFAFAAAHTELPIKVALPGPYLLSRILWLECLSEKAYTSREELARDIVSVLREELHDLLARGAAIVQFDEPVLTEVVFGAEKHGTSFMCGALSERGAPGPELDFAAELLQAVVAGAPRERLAVHVCRGNWTPDEGAALSGDYAPLVGYLSRARVGTAFLELCTPRAGDLEVLRKLPDELRVGVGVVNQKDTRIESVDEVLARARRAIGVFGRERVLLVPDCGFATFADNPVASAQVAEAKLSAIAQAARKLRERD
ncbi:MAG: cobalamin-independent methionine synthase II family protein [Planctomycetes bacterium]|nr:cobalamin-independent methionine synthase II family protein [Planctomycetota bacterium]